MLLYQSEALFSLPHEGCCRSSNTFPSNQLRVEIEDGSLRQLEEFYARHGFVRSIPDERAGPGRILLSGERDAALAAVRGILEEGDGGGADAVVMNLQARLLHDAGDLEGAVDAYLKAVQARRNNDNWKFRYLFGTLVPAFLYGRIFILLVLVAVICGC